MIETTFEFETSGLREEAKRIGLKEGREEGKKEGKLETANQLISAGVPLELIVKATKLTEEQILSYRKEFSEH
ncbi:MAG: hypothetical protein HFH08_03240 [Bacilli bacterium]|nr:hypothetical protein [Bacilli bacterium]